MTSKKRKIGFTCGAFDLCHAGHVLMFKECKDVCDYLIVFLQEDPSIDVGYREKEKNQSKNRPVMSLEERRIILDGIKYIDDVVTYTTEEDLYEKLKSLEADVRILGADWEGRKYTGWDLEHEPYFNSRGHSFSTTELRERIVKSEAEKNSNK